MILKKILGLFFSLVVVLVLSGCGDTNSTSKGTDSSSKKSETSETSLVSDTNSKQESSSFKFEKLYSTNWSEDWHGLTTKIDKVKIVEPHDPEQNLDGSTTALAVGVNFTITNNSDRDIMVYPNQGNIVIGDQQGKVNLSDSNNDLGGTISPGVTKTGVISYSLSNQIDASSIKDLRVLWKATDTKVENVDDYTKSYDISLNLQ
ncbi:hypothetical protein RV02_GL000474 [Enterococcus gilvus]|nr:hypothetical protein RV02_GL000474 [Enterococcus gilvus]